jgi:adenylate cyclase class 2
MEREIEGKFRVRMRAADLRTALIDAGYSMGDWMNQHDRVFAVSQSSVTRPIRGTVVARIRAEEGGHFLTVKRRRAADLDRDEAETVVSDPEAAEAALELLGLSLVVEVRKLRSQFSWNDRESLVVDDVQGLGVFIEIEVLAQDDGEEPERMLALRVEEVSGAVAMPLEAVTQGYDRLMVASGQVTRSPGPSTIVT